MDNVQVVNLDIKVGEETEPFLTAHQGGWEQWKGYKVEVTLDGEQYIFFMGQGKSKKGLFSWGLFADYGGLAAHSPFMPGEMHANLFDVFLQKELMKMFSKLEMDNEKIKAHFKYNKKKITEMIGPMPQLATDTGGQVH